MSTIKSSAENLTLNADGANNDIKFQSNGSEVASIDQAGLVTATTFAGSGASLTALPAAQVSGTHTNFTSTGIDDNANATAITIDANESVGIGVSPPSGGHAIWTNLSIGTSGNIISSNGAGGIYGLHTTDNAYIKSSTGGWAYLTTDEATAHTQDGGTHTFSVAPSGSADAAITFTTGLEVLNDGKARAKNGLLFGTDTAAANALDDYETGTWTPTIKGSSGSAGSAAHNNGMGSYVKVGNLVHVTFSRYMTNLGSWSGNLEVSGLPFTCAHVSAGSIANFPSTEVDAEMRGVGVPANLTHFHFYKGSRLDVRVPWSEVVTSYYMAVAATYRV